MNQLDQGTVEPIKKMLQVNRLSDGRVHVEINPSSLNTIQICPKKSEYQLNRGLVPHERGSALIAGSSIHAALEIYYMAPREERLLLPNYREKIQRMCHGEVLDDESTSLIYRATRGLINSAKPLAFLEDHEARSIPNLGWLFGEYVEDKKDDPYEILVVDGKPLVEAMYSHDIVDKPDLLITLFGTVDAIMKNTDTGQIVVVDHKTSGRIDNSFFNRVKPNHQFTAYIHLAQQCLGLDTQNFMINGFEIKAKPKTPRGKGPSFVNPLTNRTPEDIENFIKSTEYFVRQYLGWVDDGFFPYGPVDSCSNYGKCSFHDVCTSPEVIKESIIQCNYKVAKYEKA